MLTTTALSATDGVTILAPHVLDLPTFDLTNVRRKLLRESRRLWKNPLTEAEALVCEQEYREYLALCKNDPTQQRHSPSKNADYMWHAHILHMQQYHDDLTKYMGRVIFHRPAEPGLATDVNGCTECDDDCG